MKKFLTLLLCFSVFFCYESQAQVQEKIDIKFGAGATLSPSGVLGVGAAEYRLSENIAVGGMLQWSLGDLQDIIFPSFGGRVILPSRSFDSSGFLDTGFELSALFSAGPVYREINGFRSSNIGFSTGIGVDVFLSKKLSFGGTALANFTSNVVEDSYFSAFGHVGLHF